MPGFAYVIAMPLPLPAYLADTGQMATDGFELMDGCRDTFFKSGGGYACPPSRYAARISGRASNSAPVPAMVMEPFTSTYPLCASRSA